MIGSPEKDSLLVIFPDDTVLTDQREYLPSCPSQNIAVGPQKVKGIQVVTHFFSSLIHSHIFG
jgi:hypothetical protein